MANEWLEAEVLLKGADYTNQLNSPNEKEHIERSHYIIDVLKSLNFQIIATSSYSISIRGDKDAFRKAFKMIETTKSDFENLLKVPEVLKPYVEGIYLQSPPTYF
ncbi:hypothetical protein HRH25_23545 [Flavisolibacter sp. BT320]|nr:hypothetical protein [Flavisolibacter longurius]